MEQPERGDYIRLYGDPGMYLVGKTSEGKPYVIVGQYEHVISDGEAFDYDIVAMASRANGLAQEAERLSAKVARVMQA